MSKLHTWIFTFVYPIQQISRIPENIQKTIQNKFISKSQLVDENKELKIQNLLLEARVQKLNSILAENKRLKKLLHSSAKIQNYAVVAEMIGIEPNPQIKEIVINKGTKEGAFVGQPILNADGVMGQIIEVTPFSSRVLLITDNNSRIPVEINRTGYQAIAAGNYLNSNLSVFSISRTVDIKKGDLLVSSGLGDRFPAGYPVAMIDSIEHPNGQQFAIIKAKPTASFKKNRLVLMLFNKNKVK